MNESDKWDPNCEDRDSDDADQEYDEDMPVQVSNFVQALIKNAKEAGMDALADDIAHVEQVENTWVVADNYERFFSSIYTYNMTSGMWTIRNMYSDEPERPYTYNSVMADAAIMFTG